MILLLPVKLPNGGRIGRFFVSFQCSFSVRDGFFFTFVHAWFELIEDYQSFNEKEMLFPCIPGYFAILRAFLPNLQSCLIHQYHCGRIRSPYIQSSYSYNMAALKASQMVLTDSSLLNMFSLDWVVTIE